MATAAQQKQLDAESKAMFYEGASVSQLGRLFGMDNRDVAKKIADLPPSGERAGFPVYSIRDAASRLVRPDAEAIIAYIRSMNHKELPKEVSKDFWAGLTMRRKHEVLEGELWHTDEVLRTLSEAFNTLRLSLRLITDAIEREQALTDEQRAVINRHVDGALEDARVRLCQPDRRVAGTADGADPEDEESV